MPISWQARTISLGLKYIVKPVIGRVKLNEAVMYAAKGGFDIAAALSLPVPSVVDPLKEDVDGVRGEWIDISGNYETERVMLYLHGGGYFFGSAHSHRPLIWRFSAVSQLKVLAIDYRQLPAFPFPAPLSDSFTAYQWLLKQGYKPENIVIAGDSAGANLGLVTLLKIREQGLPMPACAICLSPWADLSCAGESRELNRKLDPLIPASLLRYLSRFYVGSEDPLNPYISPAHADYSDFPPLLVYVGTTEILLDDARRVARQANKANVKLVYKEWESLPHVFPLLASYVPEAKQAIKEMGQFINSHLPQA